MLFASQDLFFTFLHSVLATGESHCGQNQSSSLVLWLLEEDFISPVRMLFISRRKVIYVLQEFNWIFFLILLFIRSHLIIHLIRACQSIRFYYQIDCLAACKEESENDNFRIPKPRDFIFKITSSSTISTIYCKDVWYGLFFDFVVR